MLTLHDHPAWSTQQSRRSRETVIVAGERERKISLLMTSFLVSVHLVVSLLVVSLLVVSLLVVSLLVVSLLVAPHLAAASNPARPERHSI
jgi:hypothetical protein